MIETGFIATFSDTVFVSESSPRIDGYRHRHCRMTFLPRAYPLERASFIRASDDYSNDQCNSSQERKTTLTRNVFFTLYKPYRILLVDNYIFNEINLSQTMIYFEMSIRTTICLISLQTLTCRPVEYGNNKLSICNDQSARIFYVCQPSEVLTTATDRCPYVQQGRVPT